MRILDEIKSVAKTIQQIDNIDLYRQILNLQADVMDLLQEKNNLKIEVASLKEKLRIRESLVFKNDSYWQEKPEGLRDGPFCSNCWDTNQILVRMIDDAHALLPCYKCPSCKTIIRAKK